MTGRPAHHGPGGRYRNPWAHGPDVPPGQVDLLKWAWERLRGQRAPDPAPGALPREEPELAEPRVLAEAREVRVTWVGQATFLLQLPGVTLLTDPMFSDRASPIRWAGPRRLSPPGLALDALPPVDAVLLSHDHYDHLDAPTAKALNQRFGGSLTWFTPPGYRPWVERRGAQKVKELDWWAEDRLEVGPATATVRALPARHWTKRRPFDARKRLWCSWSVETGGRRVYFGGDSGYFPGYAEIGERVGPFDVALMPIGAYAPRWFMKTSHMNPEEAAQAARDVRAAAWWACTGGRFASATSRPWSRPGGRGSRGRAWDCRPPTCTFPLTEKRSTSDDPMTIALRRSSLLTSLALAGLTGSSACSTVESAAREFGEDGAAPVATPYQVAQRHIDAEDVDRHISFLAADARRGRGTPGAGLERAAAWLAAELQRAGLEPAGDHGGYLQYWPYDGGSLGTPGSQGSEQVPNVVGRSAGGAPATGEYVILVAHYDHLGIAAAAEDGDSIYNGADDNASGVAALVEVAQAVGALRGPLARPILFLAVSGSEEGLLGSTWFTTHPPIPLSDAVAVLNLDMVGRSHPDTIRTVDDGGSWLGPLIGRIASEQPALGLVADPAGRTRLRPSDHTPFAERGIPAVRFFSGLHDDYHTTADEADRVDADKVARVARLVFLTAHHLATRGSPQQAAP